MPYLSLRHSLLLLVLVLCGGLIIFNTFVVVPGLERDMLQRSKAQVSTTVTRLQSTLQYFLTKGDREGVQSELDKNALSDEVVQITILDRSFNPLYFSQMNKKGTQFIDHHLTLEQLNSVTRQGSVVLFPSLDHENSLYGLAPVLLDADNSEVGVLLLEVDLKAVNSFFLELLKSTFLMVGLMIFLAGGTCWLLFSRMLASRLSPIIEGANLIAEGNMETRIPIRGKDELSRISEAMNLMTAQIKEDHRELLSSHNQLNSILKNIPSIVSVKDRDGHFQLINKHYQDLFECDESVYGKTLYDVMDKDEADFYSLHDRKVIETGKPVTEVIFLQKNDESRKIHMVKFPLLDTNNSVYAVCSIGSDLSEKEQLEGLLNISQSIFENTVEAILITDENKKIVDVNTSFERITGYTKDEVLGKDPGFLTSQQTPVEEYKDMWRSIVRYGHWSGELVNKRKCGEVYHERISINSIVDDKNDITGYIGIFQDITKEKEASADLVRLAFRDPLTDLNNREAFKNKLSDAIAYSQRYNSAFGLLFIDLDYFKDVNDSHGHEIGDQLLKMVSERLLSCTRVVDIVSRLGGDEFTILVTGDVTESGLAVMASQVIKSVSEPYTIREHELIIGCSIGIALYPRDGENIEVLLKHADAAMYHAKEQGRGSFSFFDFSINEKNQRLIKIKQALRSALDRGEFSLVYQPKINPHQNVVTGYEALIRWKSRELGIVSPAEFIPIAEESGDIEGVTNWVIHRVAEDKKKSEILRESNVAINISAKQFRFDNWINTLKKLSRIGALEASKVTIEVTETALIDSFDTTLDQLTTLRKLGCKIAIDDFGTGYSSLSYLKKMPIQFLKVDRTFVMDIGVDQDDQAIVQTIIAMSHEMGIQVIAEGAESAEQVEFLRSKGCDEIQGYYFARPMRLEQLDEFHLEMVEA